MKLKALLALPLIAVISAGPAMSGALGTVVEEPDVIVPIVPVGSLGGGAVAAAVIGTIAVLAVVASGSDDAAETTTE